MANWAVQLGVQCVAWSLSAGLTVLLLPFIVVFWLWSVVTDYSTVVKWRRRRREKRPGVTPTGRFLQLKVLTALEL